MRTTLLWALLHGPVAAAALPALMLLDMDKRRAGQPGGLRNMLGFLFKQEPQQQQQSPPPPQPAAAAAPAAESAAVAAAADAAQRLLPGDPCPCGSALRYGRCCLPLHAGDGAAAAAAGPTQLLRARFAAYAALRPEFVVASTARDSAEWHADTDAWLAELAAYSRRHSAQSTSHCFVRAAPRRFIGLDLGPEKRGVSDAGEATATLIFTATLESLEAPGEEIVFTERSFFVQRAGCWYYAGGALLSAFP
ncbi:hypothetical protein JKP88DRAFT_250539 [Tribonema minus]|uniref:YchJ-like middle NTF2-like domain-containing protein n=1 Tax=Tribonema minus TaxID=303371 RepID=A0A835YGG3_9STRA|nr:hypothetical protein JKP88DRAFT_250539 [Tribonema minus]